MRKGNWTLVHISSGKAVDKDESVFSFRGKGDFVLDGRPPHKPSSTGTITVRGGTFFPSVFGLKWVCDEKGESK